MDPAWPKNEKERRIGSYSAVHIASLKKTKQTTKKKRSKRNYITSRHFPKVVTHSFRFAPGTKIRSSNGDRKSDSQKYSGDDDTSPKIVTKTTIAENNQDSNFGYSLFTEKERAQITKVKGKSNYFLWSAASARASVQSLGPLVYTWIDSSNYNDIRSNCLLHTSISTSNRKPCNPCWKILTEEGFRHFLDCPIFEKELDTFITNSEFAKFLSSGKYDNKSTCVELVGRWAEEHSLRHLCPNQCFQRAFAPSREWIVLRKTLAKFRPIGEVLNDWTCRLVNETEVDKDGILRTNSSLLSPHGIGDEVEIFQEDSTRILQGCVPRTIFVSLKTGEVRKLVIVYDSYRF